MASIFDMLSSDLGQQLISGASQQLGVDKKNTGSAMAAAMPLILGALQNNAQTQDGASGLLGALMNSKHNGARLDNMSSILGGDHIDDDVMEDGGKILNHVFKGQQQNAAQAIGKSSGIDMKQAMGLMQAAAPFIMSYLGRQTQQAKVSNQSGLQDMLGGLLGGAGSQQQDMASKIQSFTDNDSSIDDIAGMLGGALNKSGGLGGLLGGFLKG